MLEVHTLRGREPERTAAGPWSRSGAQARATGAEDDRALATMLGVMTLVGLATWGSAISVIGRIVVG